MINEFAISNFQDFLNLPIVSLEVQKFKRTKDSNNNEIVHFYTVLKEIGRGEFGIVY
jgi:hypothetical protein